MTSPRRRSTLFRTLAGALALGTALTLTGCGGDSDSADSGGVTTISFWDNNGGPARTPYFEELIKRFEAANPTIKVEYLGLPADSVQQKYDTAIAGGGTPDIGGVQQCYVAGLIAQGALEPLDDVSDSATLKGNIDTAVLDSIKASATDDKLYMLPVSVNLDILWYRADLFDAAGLKAPDTWDDFFTASDTLTDPAANQFGFSIRGGAGGTAVLLSAMYGYSGITDFFDADGSSTIADPKNVEAIEKIAALYGTQTSKADVTNGYKEMCAEFDGGTAAMMLHNLGSYSDHLKALGADKFAAAGVPAAADGTRTLIANAADGFAVFNASEHKAEAKKFLEFMLSKESNSYWNENVGQLPVQPAGPAGRVGAAEPGAQGRPGDPRRRGHPGRQRAAVPAAVRLDHGVAVRSAVAGSAARRAVRAGLRDRMGRRLHRGAGGVGHRSTRRPDRAAPPRRSTRTRTGGDVMRGIELWGYAYPWDLESGGAASQVADRLGVDTVAVAAAYHSVRAATPLHRDRRMVEAVSSAAYFPVRERVWRGRRLVPAAPTWAAPDAFVAAPATRSGAAGRRPAAWVVLTHNSRLGRAFPDLTVRNAFGDSYPHALCPSQPEVREYAATLAAEAVPAGGTDRVVLEACAALGAAHGAAHDKSATALDGSAGSALLSLCFCPGAGLHYRAAGLDADQCAEQIRTAVTTTSPVDPIATFSAADVADALRAVRRRRRRRPARRGHRGGPGRRARAPRSPCTPAPRRGTSRRAAPRRRSPAARGVTALWVRTARRPRGAAAPPARPAAPPWSSSPTRPGTTLPPGPPCWAGSSRPAPTGSTSTTSACCRAGGSTTWPPRSDRRGTGPPAS